MVREGRVLISVATDPDFGASYSVTACKPGAQVSAIYDGTGIPVRAGHGFAALDKFIVGTDKTKYRAVTSVTSTKIFCSTVSVASGDLLVNLGQDTGATEPNYDVPGTSIYTDMDYSNLATNSTVQTDAYGRYRYWHKGINRWELVRTGTTLTALYTDTSSSPTPSSVRYANLEATGGIGTSGSPWTGWAGSVAANTRTIFVPGYYSVTEVASLGSGSHIDCSPGATFLRSASFLSINAFNTGGAAINDFKIAGATFDNNSLAVTNYDVYVFEGSSRFSVTDCRWVNLTNRAYTLTYVGGTTVATSYFQWSGCTVEAADNATPSHNSFWFVTPSDYTVSDNTITGWGAIKVEGYTAGLTYNHKILRNAFRNVDQTCIFVRAYNGHKMYGVEASGNRVVQTVAMTQEKGLLNIGGGNASGGGFYNCSVSNNSSKGGFGHALQLGVDEGGTPSAMYNSSVVGNVIDGRLTDESTLSSQNRGINCDKVYGITISGNSIKYVGRSGILVGATDSADVVIVGNKIEYASQYANVAPDPSKEAGIVLWLCNRARVENNHIYNTANSTLAASYNTVGLYVTELSTSVHVVNNTLLDDRSPSGMNYGVVIGDNGTQLKPSGSFITGNSILGYGVNPIVDFTASATVKTVYEKNRTTAGDQGSTITSAATITIPTTGDWFGVSGVVNITSIVASWSGRRIVLEFLSTAVVTNGNNLHLAGDFAPVANDQLSLFCDGTYWNEIGRSTGDVRGRKTTVALTSSSAISTAGTNLIDITNTSGTNTPTLVAPASMDGKILILRCVALTAGTITLADSGTCSLSAAWAPNADDTLTLIASGTVWYEIARSAN